MSLAVRVLPDVKGFEKTFDYLVPGSFRDQIRVGTIVRIRLSGRDVRGWVVAVDVEPPTGVVLSPIRRVVGWGPRAELVDLAHWAAHRWFGRTAHLLTTASPDNTVLHVVERKPVALPVPVTLDVLHDGLFQGAGAVFRLPPTSDGYNVAISACRRGNALILVPTVGAARQLGARLRRGGIDISLAPRDWAQIAGGGSAIGTRAAVWAPVRDIKAIVVFDEHDESHQQAQSPTWNARDVAIERARRAGVPCVLVSPMPTLEALDTFALTTVSRSEEREGWPIIDIVDVGRDTDKNRGLLLTDRAMSELGSQRRVIVVTNVTGQAKLLACVACDELARCETCDAIVGQPDEQLVCARCGTNRPVICLACGSSRMKRLRRGAARLRSEIEASVGEPVVEVTASTSFPLPEARVYVGTEAVLRQVRGADVVVFVDIDGELFAPRYRANEQAMALLSLAARLVGARSGGGRIIVQTRHPRHAVFDAVLHSDPGRLVAGERLQRAALGFPPSSALAEVSGVGAPGFCNAVRLVTDRVDVLGPTNGRYLLRATDHTHLSRVLAAVERPAGRLRVEVDPLRV